MQTDNSLGASGNVSQSVKKAVMLFKSCVDISSSDKLKIKPLQEFLLKLKLPLLPNLLFNSINTENSESSNETTVPSKFDWIYSIVYMKRLTGIDKLIGFEVCMSCHDLRY